MATDNQGALVVPLPTPELHQADCLDLLAGEALPKAPSVTPKVLADDAWLDELADTLSEQGWLELDLTHRLHAGLLPALYREVATLSNTDAMDLAGVGRGADLVQDHRVRRDKIAWLEGITEPQGLLFQTFDTLMAGLNQRLYLGLKRFEAHYATYQPGDFYKRHVDSFRGRSSRMVSLVIYLNEDWGLEDGGELRLFHPENDDLPMGLVRPKAGRAVLFLSEEIPHEVLPAKRTRFSIACWFRRDEIPLPL